jgi:cobalt-zinc-cadmium resistance protein CzcA
MLYMVKSIISFSVRNKLFVGFLVLSLIAGGIFSASRLRLDAVPDITNNQLQIISQAPSLSAEDIEQYITLPVEVAVGNLPGLEEIRSVSRFGLSVVTVVFDEDQGSWLPRQMVYEQLGQLDLPAHFGKPYVGPLATGLGEIYQYTLDVEPDYKDVYSLEGLRAVQDWIIKRQMAMLPGVVEVNSIGGSVKQYEVAVDPTKLASYGLSLIDVFLALEKNNNNSGGAYIEKSHLAYFIRGEGMLRSLAEIAEIPVLNKDGLPVLIGDIAEVTTGGAVRYGAATRDGQEVVGGIVMMLKGANANEVIHRVKARMKSIDKTLPPGLRINTFLDRSELIGRTTGTVSENLIVGGLIVVFVLVLLLGNWRGGLIVASTIPLSLLFAFIMMDIFGVWANLMSLGAIDFGIIVDGAVIIAEGVVYSLRLHVSGLRLKEQSDFDARTIKTASSMMQPAFFGQLIILIVFAPILTLVGVEGKMFRPMALTFGFAMMGAILLCLTYVPMMSAWLLCPASAEKKSFGDKVIGMVQKAIDGLLAFALKIPAMVVGLAITLIVVAGFLFSRMGAEFLPQLDEGDIAFHVMLKPGSSLSETIKKTTLVEKIINDEFPEIATVVSRIGVAETPNDPMPMEIADVVATFHPEHTWKSGMNKADLMSKLKYRLEKIPAVSFEFTQPIEMRFNELLTGVREDVAIKLYGDDLDILAQKAKEIGRLVSGIQGVEGMRVEATSGLPQLSLSYKRQALARHGISIDDANMALEAAFAGSAAGVIYEGQKQFDLVLRLDRDHRDEADEVGNVLLRSATGQLVPLRELADIKEKAGPMQISRDNTARHTVVGVNVGGRDVQSLVDEISQRLDAGLTLPPGYFIRYGGAFENLQRATSRLKLVTPAALLLIFVLVFAALRSLSQTCLIFVAVPLAAVGGVFGLWARGMPFSISAGVGFVVLFGVAVLNGLVLISILNELKTEGLRDVKKRLHEGVRRRVRPILLTASTDILGFLPMALSTSSGAEVQRPLATVVIGGLLTATLLTVVVIPVLYFYLEKKREGNDA